MNDIEKSAALSCLAAAQVRLENATYHIGQLEHDLHSLSQKVDRALASIVDARRILNGDYNDQTK